MTIPDLIREHLGDAWWRQEHDQTSLCALLDRIQEETNLDPIQAYSEIVWATVLTRPSAEGGSKFYAAVRLAIPETVRENLK